MTEESLTAEAVKCPPDIEAGLNDPPFFIPLLLGGVENVQAMVDSGCQCFSAVEEKLARRIGRNFIDIPPRPLQHAQGIAKGTRISQLVALDYDLDGWRSQLLAYVVPCLSHQLILGRPWLCREGVVMDIPRGELIIRKAGNMVVQESGRRPHPTRISIVSGSVMAGLLNQEPRQEDTQVQIFATNILDISRATYDLRPTKHPGSVDKGGPIDIHTIHVAGNTVPHKPKHETGKTKLPPELQEFKDLFDKESASGLPPHRGSMDHHVRLTTLPDGTQPNPPWGPLYPMSRDQLLELRTQLTGLMDKGWIRASSSAAGAPVLLVKKPSGGWRLCVDYRMLNSMTTSDRYPLPLIKETLRTLSGANWFTKVDVRAAFHKVRMAEGHESLTAFRTRFGLYEWLVCPFGLSGAPSTFQRYINAALAESLGLYATAYLDDVLIYSGGDRFDHMEKVKRVLTLLKEAGLHLDLEKCAFGVKEVRYLGYIVEAGKSLRPDPEKLRAVREWESPRNVREVRSFLGFANFYRDFIAKFSEVAAPLNRLTGKNTPFQWGEEEQSAFDALKKAFVSGPVLTQWDPARETLLEADCSGCALGGCLSQKVGGVWRPVAYHSAALTPERRNYTIHDKELLAIVECLKSWSAELQSVHKPFTIFTDHKNLEYFTSLRSLSERQCRWAEELSKYRYILQYRPGRLAGRPDALSRRPQDSNSSEATLQSVMRPESIQVAVLEAEEASKLPKGASLFADLHMQTLWDKAVLEDETYQVRLDAVQKGARSFPVSANTKQQIGDCAISAHGTLLWRGVIWLPTWEPLTTTVIQRAHESGLAGHPGKNTTFQILRRDYHWDGMSGDVARYVRNCHCYGAHISRKRRQGLLQPIPVASRYWSQISMDFMVDLPAKDDSKPRSLLVITDRLSKYVQLEATVSMAADHCARIFRDNWWRFRGFPSSIITDRGSDWLGSFWTTLCQITKINQLLSTAYHPQTDGGTERANQEVQAVLRMMVCFEQTDWPDCLPACQLALNNRDSSTTGVSPNLLLNGYTADTLQKSMLPLVKPKNPRGEAVAFLSHLQRGAELAQAAIAFQQQRQQEATNRSRRPAEKFLKGDMVWFAMRNIKTNRPSKKFDWLQVKYKVMEVPTPLTVVLDLPGSLHKTVHVDLLERAANDPLPSQKLQDSRPGPTVTLENEDATLDEWEVEEILCAKNARGKGKRQVLVKWKGYVNPTWHPLEVVQDAEALDRFEEQYGDAAHNDGPMRTKTRKQGRKETGTTT